MSIVIFMEKYEHGGSTRGEILYDFSANINPLGLPENVKRALSENADKFAVYPDVNCTRLTEKIAEIENIPPEKIVCGNGAADIIYRLVYAVKPKRALLLAPAFSEYEKALSEVGCEIKYHCLRDENDFFVAENLLDDLQNIDIFFLCNPNNPTGKIVDTTLLRKISERCKNEKILLVCDECFLGFTENSEKYSLPIKSGNVVIKAFTKLYAMAGLRLGYALFGDDELPKKVRRTGQCWSVSVPAQLAGEAALSDKNYVSRTLLLIKKERDFLTRELSELGIKVYPSDANFLLLKSDLPIEKLLLEHKIAARNCENFIGLDERFIRIAVRTHYENAALVNALKTIVGGK